MVQRPELIEEVKRLGFSLEKQMKVPHRRSENFLYLCDNQGVLVVISEPISSEHHDLADIKSHFHYLMTWLEKADIRTDGLFLNADAGFDSQECRNICQTYQIEANIDFNPRNGSINDRYEYFDEISYQKRFVIERAFA